MSGQIVRPGSHFEREHACTQEAAGNLSSQSIASQAEKFQACLCHGAVDTAPLRRIRSTCECVIHIATSGAQTPVILRLLYDTAMFAEGLFPPPHQADQCCATLSCGIMAKSTAEPPRREDLVLSSRKSTGKASIDEVKGEVEVCQLAREPLQALANRLYMSRYGVSLKADAGQAWESLHLCVGKLADEAHLSHIQLDQAPCHTEARFSRLAGALQC